MSKLHRFWKEVGDDYNPRLAKSAKLNFSVPRRQIDHVGTGSPQ